MKKILFEVNFEMKTFASLETLSHPTWPVSILQWNTVPIDNSDTPKSDISQNTVLATNKEH